MPKSIILDTNILVLLITGLTNPEYIEKHKRLQVYDLEDFSIVEGIVNTYTSVSLCPNVLSETSNLIRHIREPIRSEIMDKMREFVRLLGERYIDSTEAVAHDEYTRLGLTDAVLMKMAETGGDLLTDDLDLYLAALSRGLSATNYNHIREMRPGFA